VKSHAWSSLWSLFRKIMRILVLYMHQDLFCLPLDRVAELPRPAPPEGVRFERIDERNVEDGTRWLGAGTIRRFRRFLRRGDIGLYAYLDDEPVLHGWCMVRAPGRRLVGAHDPIEPGEALLHRGYARLQARRRGIGSSGLIKTLDWLASTYAAQGIERVCTAILVENKAAQGQFRKMGFMLVSRITTLVLLGHCFIYRFHDAQPDGSFGPGRLRVAFKLPDIFWDPAFDRFRPRQSVALRPPDAGSEMIERSRAD
jgi:ribosomal protein S18 acetylase RimI-like enzyme